MFMALSFYNFTAASVVLILLVSFAMQFLRCFSDATRSFASALDWDFMAALFGFWDWHGYR
jgi:hypothetical protein